MSQIVFLLEESSAKNMLKGIENHFLSENVEFQYIVFEGKQDLEKQVVKKIKHWEGVDTRFIVIRDQDSGDCYEIKRKLTEKVQDSGKADVTLIRIVCHELESFFLGDLEAVEKGLSIHGISKKQNTKKYRNPDELSNASQELKILTKGKYKKLAGSEAISPYLKLNEKNKSKSFNVLIGAIQRFINELENNSI